MGYSLSSTQDGVCSKRIQEFIRQGGGVDVWEELRSGSLLGGEGFVDIMRARLLDTPLDQNVLRRVRGAARPSLEKLSRDVADKSDRNARMHDAVHLHHYKLQVVANHLGLHFTTISVIAKRQIARIQEQSSDPT